MFMALDWSFNNNRIFQIGRYIREEIEDKWAGSGWENHLRSPVSRPVASWLSGTMLAYGTFVTLPLIVLGVALLNRFDWSRPKVLVALCDVVLAGVLVPLLVRYSERQREYVPWKVSPDPPSHSVSNRGMNIMAGSDRIVDEHFWFTATTVTVNALVASAISKPGAPSLTFKVLSTVISAFAMYLILQRSAAHAGKIKVPQELLILSESDKTFRHKIRETWASMKIVPSHLLFVVGEFSGALFYLVLVGGSCLFVWLAH